jgi:hypothetical protein
MKTVSVQLCTESDFTERPDLTLKKTAAPCSIRSIWEDASQRFQHVKLGLVSSVGA